MFTVHKNADICECHAIMKTRYIIHDIILIYHLASLKISIRCLVVDNSVHDEVHMCWIGAFFGDEVTSDILIRLQLFEIPRVKIVITVLQKAMYFNRILIQELCKLCFQINRENFEQIRHFCVSFNCQISVQIGIIIFQLVHK